MYNFRNVFVLCLFRRAVRGIYMMTKCLCHEKKGEM